MGEVESAEAIIMQEIMCAPLKSPALREDGSGIRAYHRGQRTHCVSEGTKGDVSG